jgi:type I restriction enzyme S subunit
VSLPRHATYKAVHSPFLVELPTHWELKRLKHLADVFPSNVDKKSYEGQIAVRLCNYTDVYYNERITAELELMPATATADQIERFRLRAGDVIITKDSETADDIAVAAHVPEDLPGVVCGYHLAMVRPLPCLSGAFAKRFFDSQFAKAQFFVSANGLTRVGLGRYELDNALVPAPPIDEQLEIVEFLDRETAKIDALVAEQRRLMELLQEKRQAVISHAVTKGLNPDAPMTPSGVDWLGEVPAHWKQCRIRHAVSFTTSGPRGWSELLGEVGALFVQSGNLGDALEVDFATASRVQVADNAEAVRTSLHGGDIVVCITGAKTGNVAVCTSVPEPAYVNQHLCLLRPQSHVEPRFLGMQLKSRVGQTHFDLSQYGLKQGLSLEDIREAPVLLPPLDEQRAIVAYADAVLADVESLKNEGERAIALLEERRSTLISAAVTGQVDVRQLAGAEAA